MATTPPTAEERLARLEGVYDHLASKADLAELRAVSKADLAELRAVSKADLAELRVVLKDDIARVESDLRADLARVESDLRADIARVQADIAELKGSFKILLIAMTSGLALLNVVLRFWPS